MKKQLIKSAAIIVLVFLFGNIQAQKCDNFGKRKHKGRTSIYKAVDLGDLENVTGKTKSELMDGIDATRPNDSDEKQAAVTREQIIASIKDGKETKIFKHSLKRSEKRECRPFK